MAGAALASIALLAGCAAAPTTSTGGGSTKSKVLPCIVSDAGGFDDHSFNQLGLQGVEAAAKKLGVGFKKVQSATASDAVYEANIGNLIKQGCTIIVASGFNLVTAVTKLAPANPKVRFITIDDNSIKQPNVKPVVFQTDEAAFLGGYAAAAYSKTHVVATFGGANYPTVSIYMDGIADGIQYYNKQKGTDVKLLGWNVDPKKSTYVGDFSSQGKAKTITTNFLNSKADVIIPVAGSLYQGAGAAIQSTKADAVLEGVDADLFLTDTKGYKDIMLTSILKNIQPATEATVETAAKSGTFDNSQYLGTLKNNGVALSSFHNFESKIPATLADELTTIKAGIISGSITVTSTGAFTE